MSSLNSACKKCRREGVQLFLKGDRCFALTSKDKGEKAIPKCAFLRRAKGPGQHGSTNQSKLSDYGQQLREKQKLKRIYGLREKQFSLLVKEAVRMPGVTGSNLLMLLELRLDSVAYRLGMCSSRRQARQFVGHGHLSVNGRRVDIPSYKVKVGDIIEICENSKSHKFLIECLEKNANEIAPEWLIFDKKTLTGSVIRLPERDEIKMNEKSDFIQEQLIVEYYSR